MSVFARLEPIDKLQGSSRGAPRFVLRLGTMLGHCGSSAVIHDLSATGLRFETAANLEAGDVFEVELPHMGAAKTTVIWRKGSSFGCQFAHPIPQAVVSAALLQSEPASGDWQRAETRPRIDRSPSSLAGHNELDRRHVPLALRVLRVLGIAALLVGGLAYITITGDVVALAILAVLAVLLALLVGWGFWILDNTLEF